MISVGRQYEKRRGFESRRRKSDGHRWNLQLLISLSYVTVNLVYYDFCLCAKVGSLSLVIACLSCVTACYSVTLVIVAVCQLWNKRITITTITVIAADAKICCIYNNDFQL